MKRSKSGQVEEALEPEMILPEQDTQNVDPTSQCFTSENVILLSEDKVLFFFKEKDWVYFKGKVFVEVLIGELEVIGATLKPEDGPTEVFSPRGYSLLYLAGKRCDEKNKAVKDLEQQLAKHPVNHDLRKRLISEWNGSTVAVLTRVNIVNDSISKHLQYSSGGTVSLFGREQNLGYSSGNLLEAEKRLSISFCSLNQDVRVRLYQPNPEWETAVLSAKIAIKDGGQPRLLAAGGKGVGKSTFIRYLINRLISETGKPVLVIDLDPGQAEFTVPGCLSCTLVQKPILGPNFTHVNHEKELCLFVGGVDVTEAKVRYDSCLKMLGEFSKGFPSVPWVINSMGFTQGLGAFFMQESVTRFMPTTLVEITSRSYKKNFQPREFFQNLAASLTPRANVLRFAAMPESLDAKDMGVQDFWGIPQPGRLRDIVMLSHFELSFPECPLKRVTPRAISWGEVFIQVLFSHKSFSISNLVKILNTGFVSLGHLPDEQSQELKSETLNLVNNPEIIVPSLGFGVVRSVDVKRKLFYVVTNLDQETLMSVNCLTLGVNIRLPNGLLITQNSAKQPYVSTNNSACLLSTPWQRHNKPKNLN